VIEPVSDNLDFSLQLCLVFPADKEPEGIAEAVGKGSSNGYSTRDSIIDRYERHCE